MNCYWKLRWGGSKHAMKHSQDKTKETTLCSRQKSTASPEGFWPIYIGPETWRIEVCEEVSTNIMMFHSHDNNISRSGHTYRHSHNYTCISTLHAISMITGNLSRSCMEKYICSLVLSGIGNLAWSPFTKSPMHQQLGQHSTINVILLLRLRLCKITYIYNPKESVTIVPLDQTVRTLNGITPSGRWMESHQLQRARGRGRSWFRITNARNYAEGQGNPRRNSFHYILAVVYNYLYNIISTLY